MSIKVTSKKNEKVLLALKEIPAELKKLHVRIGVPAGAVTESKKGANGEMSTPGLPLWKIAAVHEFGAPEHGIPERQPLRRALKWGNEKLKKRITTDLKKVMAGSMEPHTAMDRLGVDAVGVVQEYIAGPGQTEMEPLLESTVSRKGSSAILIDTGQLRQSYKHEVRDD